MVVFSYPIWDPSSAIKQLVNNNEIYDKSIGTNCVPAITYFLADALLINSETLRLIKRIEQINYFILKELDTQKLELELKEKNCEMLLYLSYPAIIGNVEELDYLTKKYDFKRFESGEYDTFLFYLTRKQPSVELNAI